MMSAQEDYDVLMDNQGGPNLNNSGSGSAIFPLARIKKIMKADKEVNLVAADAVNLVSFATELFLDNFVKKASELSQNEKRRTILYKDFATAVKQDLRYSFLQELVPETVSIQAALEAQKHHGMTSSITPSNSPVHDNDDHFDSFKSSTSNLEQFEQGASQPATSSSMKPSKSAADFFTKRPTGNVNFLLNNSGTSVGGGNEEIIEISDDIVN